jgi:8-oxo-dGTP pyrophosphatase MutT (NUDIX family)
MNAMDRSLIISRIREVAADGSLIRTAATTSVEDDTPREPMLRGDHDLNPEHSPHPDPTPAAVLVPLVEREHGFTVLLTERTAHLSDHAGQVAFPGGRAEPEDDSPEETALRETAEEIGLTRDRIEIIGRLDTYVTGTGYAVTPVIGIVTPPFDLEPDEFEVADIFEVPLDFLMDAENHRLESRVWKGRRRHYYVMPYEERFIWGATAGMIRNLHDVLKREGRD